MLSSAESLIALETARLNGYEGVVDHLYLDTRGNVTVGMGYMLPNVAEALLLPFKVRAEAGTLATQPEIALDYQRVEAMRPGLLAKDYRPATSLCLLPSDIDHLASLDLEQTLIHLELSIPGFANLPEAWQEALLDMGYNLGVTGLMRYRAMLAAIGRGDGTGAAAQCHRGGIDDERNAETAALFTDPRTPGAPIVASTPTNSG